MPYLSEPDKDQLQEIFTQQLCDPVRLRLLTRPTSRLFIHGQDPRSGRPSARLLRQIPQGGIIAPWLPAHAGSDGEVKR